MSKRKYHRLRYREIQDLSREGKTLCGYLREPLYQTRSNKVRGFCYLKKEFGRVSICKDHKLPMPCGTDCEYYKRWESENRHNR